jgi:hypothetical protein
MIDNNKVDVNRITKFDVQYFHVWKHIIALVFNKKRFGKLL